MLKKASIILLSVVILTANLNCSKEAFCNNKALCDLFGKTILPAAGVLLGVDIKIVSSIYNVAASNVDCGTEMAPASRSDFDVEFRANASSPWEILAESSNKVIEVRSIVADGPPDITDVEMTFNEPGDYRFKTVCDFPEDVTEREEANNESCAGCRLSSNNVSYSEVLTVYPNPDIPYDPTKPQVVIKSINKIQ